MEATYILEKNRIPNYDMLVNCGPVESVKMHVLKVCKARKI